MNCELCGNSIRGEVQVVNIDGGVFRVCNNCAKLGTPVRVPKPVPVRTDHSLSPHVPVRAIPRNNAPPPSPGFSYESEEMILREDYSSAIKGARESLGITQEELGRKINEKPSMIGHLEVGSMKPDDLLAKKLEHFLKIQLFVPIEEELSSDTR
ncbi:MAG: TIGR00270 family protein [Nitrososphaerota archaeon]|nr:TIGR00270 family protein [Nitrososphaerota archaeon]